MPLAQLHLPGQLQFQAGNFRALQVLAVTSEIEKTGLRLGFVSDRPMFDDGESLWMEPMQARLLSALRDRVQTFSFAMSCDPTHRELFSRRWEPTADSRAFRLPYIASFAEGFFRVAGCRKVVRAIERESDVVVIQAPFSAVYALTRPRCPRVYQMTADVISAAAARKHLRGAKRLIAGAGARVIDRIQQSLIQSRSARLVAHGEELWKHFGTENGIAILSGTLHRDEILSVSRSRPTDAPFRVLYVGYLRYWKGVDVLLEAFDALRGQIPNAELRIVGSADDNSHGIDELVRRRADGSSVNPAITLMGNRKFGPGLFQEYADADVLVVPSRGGEGTPRVLVEARAFACPVIGTRVSGIPFSIDDEVDGLLIPPEDPSALAEAMLRIARDHDLRARLKAGGIERARRTTIECMADSILSQAVLLTDTQLAG